MWPGSRTADGEGSPAGGSTQAGSALPAWGRRLLPGLSLLALVLNGSYFLEWTSGILAFLVAGGTVVAALLLARTVGEALCRAAGRPRALGALGALALAAGGAAAGLVLIESGLQLLAWWQAGRDREAARTTLAMPAEWERRPAEVPGAALAYYWHGILHVHNADGLRRVEPFPPKRPGTLRVAVFGDSLTYGYGVAAEEAYPAVLERLLAPAFRVEVLNLGVSGAQSQEILRNLRTQVPRLEPDLAVYGVCLNDFLPSDVGQYQTRRDYAVPLPAAKHLAARTRTGKLLERQYDVLLMRLGLRADFLGDILADFAGYRTRFARDAQAMSAYLQGRGLPPLVALVLHQYPDTRSVSYRVIQAAERHLEEAGVRVIPSDYIRRHDGRTDWHVSRWEGHPNAAAHRVFAEELARSLGGLPELARVRRAG